MAEDQTNLIVDYLDPSRRCGCPFVYENGVRIEHNIPLGERTKFDNADEGDIIQYEVYIVPFRFKHNRVERRYMTGRVVELRR